MMWKTLIFLTVASVVLAGKTNNKRNANYSFQIKHDYDYLKHREKTEHHKIEEKAEEEQAKELEQEGDKKEENQEQSNESDEQSAESEKPENDDENEVPGYEFLYKVIDPHTHDNKGQHEKKHGGEIKGVYWLLQPDGYKRTVDYHIDKHNGFQAKVNYEKSEEHKDEDEHSKPKSEYYVKTYKEPKKYIPVREEQDEEQDRQEESAEHTPIYVI